MPDAFEHVLARRDRKRRNQRVAAGVLGIAVFALAAIGFVRLLGSERTPASDPRSPFQGTWVSTTDADGGTQTMTIRAPQDGAVDITVRDDAASVCSGAPSTMTGTGRLEGARELVIPSPLLTCDDGSEPEALSGPPLQEQLRDLTFVHDSETDALTDNFGSVWERVRGDEQSPEPTMSGGMWPQSNLDEVREAQRLADEGDPAYTWQVEPELEAHLGDAEIFARFLREELGWDGFLWNPFAAYEGGFGDPPNHDEAFSGVVYLQCAPDRTNPLYPNDVEAGTCAPTIDDFTYETVQLDVARLARRGLSGIWVVTSWRPGPAFRQMTPPSDAEVTELVDAFLAARVDGEGAEQYLPSPGDAEFPLLYATTSGAPYERYEYELVEGPVWPTGSMEFEVRLFAEGGRTVVEQPFILERVGDRLELDYGSQTTFQPATIENGEAVALPYEFLDGEVTFAAAPPWDYSFAGWDHLPGGLGITGPSTMTTLLLEGNYDERVAVLADPLPVETGCQEGPAPADAEALARTIRSDPDLEATEPVAASVGGVAGLRMDVVAARGASVCNVEGSPQVMTSPGLRDPIRHFGVEMPLRHRMRLYLLDLPGGSARIVAIAISAPEARFQRVVEAAAPIVDSFQFRTR